MSLPNLPAKDNYRREVRTEWGGINLNENAGDGELIEAVNMSSREFPLLATERMEYPTQYLEADFAAYMQDGKPGWIKRIVGPDDAVSYKLFDPTTTNGTLVDIPLTYAQHNSVEYAHLQNRMVILPIKKVYDFTDHTLKDMGSSFDSGASTVIFRDGTINGVPADDNTIYCSGVDWADYFSVGDGVTIAGSGLPENNKTAIIREIEGDELRFDENCFTTESYWHLYLYDKLSAGFYYFYTGSSTWLGFNPTDEIPAGVMLELRTNSIYYQAPGSAPVSLPTYTGGTPSGRRLTFLPPADAAHVTITRTVPGMDFVCVNENRIWGCKGDAIYASKLGDPYNWNVFDGLSTDSWSVNTGTPGDFTGCCSYQGYPTFFKEGCAFKVLGDEPGNFTLRKVNIVGVAEGSNKSIVEIQGLLYYVSHLGVVQWNGGDYPTIISGALGRSPGWMDGTRSAAGGHGTGAKAGTDGIRYFVYMFRTGRYINWRENGSYTVSYTTRPGLHVYDPRFGTWHTDTVIANVGYAPSTRYEPSFCGDGSKYYMLWVTYTEIDDDVYDYNTARIQLSMSPQPEDDVPENWAVTFADSTRAYKTALTGSESKKGVLRLLIRCRLAGTMKVWISYDGGDFEEAAEFSEMAKTSKVVPLILRRCDFWQLRLTGTGDAVIYSIAVERYGGEWQQA